MFSKIDYTIVMVSDMERSVRFYRDVLGLTLRFQSDSWSELDTAGTTLALHGGAASRPSALQGKGEQWAGTMSLGFSVRNLDHAVQELRRRGVRFVVEPGASQEDGIRLAAFTDPDGVAISVAEPARAKT